MRALAMLKQFITESLATCGLVGMVRETSPREGEASEKKRWQVQPPLQQPKQHRRCGQGACGQTKIRKALGGGGGNSSCLLRADSRSVTVSMRALGVSILPVVVLRSGQIMSLER